MRACMCAANSTKPSPNARRCNETTGRPDYSALRMPPPKETLWSITTSSISSAGKLADYRANTIRTNAPRAKPWTSIWAIRLGRRRVGDGAVPDASSERRQRPADANHIIERHIALAKLPRPPCRTPARQFDAGILDLGAGERHAARFAKHLKAPPDTQFSFGGQQPGRNTNRVAEQRGLKVSDHAAQHRHASIELQAFLDRQTKRCGVFPGGAVEPRHVHGVVDVLIGIDIGRSHRDQGKIRGRQVPHQARSKRATVSTCSVNGKRLKALSATRRNVPREVRRAASARKESSPQLTYRKRSGGCSLK